jgi:hypothetical protein
VTVQTGQTTVGIDFQLRPGGARVSGNVKDRVSGAALSNVNVDIYDATGRYVVAGTTNGSGAFAVAGGLPTGRYFARTSNSGAYAAQLYNNKDCAGCDVTTGTPLDIAAGSIVSGIDFNLDEGSRISGRVTDANGIGIALVWVHIENPDGGFATGGNTDATGAYISNDALPPGVYYARTYNSFGYVNGAYRNRSCPDCPARQVGDPVSIIQGLPTVGIDFTLPRGGRIAGRVTDESSGQGIGGVQVQILDANGVWSGVATTDSTGAYVVTSGLPQGQYFVRTWSTTNYRSVVHGFGPCAGCNPLGSTPGQLVTVRADETTVVDLALTLGGRVGGRVTDSSGAPIANVNVGVYSSTGTWLTTANTDALGNYATEALAPGTYYARTFNSKGFANQLYAGIPCLNCSVTSGTSFVAVLDALTTGIDFVLVPGAGGYVRGRVTDATGTGVPGTAVEIFGVSGQPLTWGSTSADGTYVTVDVLPPGTYFARTYHPGGYIRHLYGVGDCPTCDITTGTPLVMIEGADVTGVDFVIRAGARIAGRVTAADTGLGLPNVEIHVVNAQNRFATVATTDAGGRYTLTDGLPTGTYYVRTINARPYVNGIYPGLTCLNFCDPVIGTGVLAGAPGTVTAGIDLVLARGAEVSGRVTDAATGAGLGNVSVEIVTPLDQWLTSTNTGASGAYVQRDALPPGTYYVKTWNAGNYQNEIYPGLLRFGNPVTAGAPLILAEGDSRTGIDFALSLGGRIGGRVTDSAGTPLANVNVQAFSSTGVFVTGTNTDGQGNYATQGIGAGSYFVRTNSVFGQLNELYNNILCLSCAVTGGAPVTVTTGQMMNGIDFALATGGQISGVVSDPSGAPLANVNVQVFSATGSFVTGTNTNASGQYTTAGIPAGNYFVRTNNTLGYINMLYSNIECLNCSVLTGTPVPVVVGQVSTGVDFRFRASGRFSGTVRNSTGAPQANLTVQVFNALTGLLAVSASTNAEGSYSTQAPAGTYFVRTSSTRGLIDQVYDSSQPVSCSGNFCLGPGTPVPLADGATVEINFTLAPGGVITGTVRDQGTGLAMPGVTVNVQDATGRSVTSVNTDSAGVYTTLVGLPAGTYYARTVEGTGQYVDEFYSGGRCIGNNCPLTSATPVAVGSAAVVSSIDFGLRRGGRFSGTVTDAAGNPVSGILVDVTMITGIVVASAITDASGNFTTRAVPAGSYHLKTNSALGHLNAYADGTECVGICSPTLGTPGTVTAVDGVTAAGMKFTLRAGGRIAGRVVNAASGAGLQGIGILISDATNRVVSTANTDSTGAFISAAGLPDGDYFARTNNVSGFVDSRFDGLECVACPGVTATPIAVTLGGTTTGINFALASGARITGTVVTDAGRPLNGVAVQILDAAGRLVTTGTTNNFGLYATAGGLSPGSYFVRTPALVAGGFVSEIYPGVPCLGTCDLVSGAPVIVSGTSTVNGIDFSLSPGGRVGGQVLDGSGDPPAFVTVGLYDQAGRLITTAVTDVHGRYLLGAGVPTGTYFVRTFAAELVNEAFDNVACLACDVRTTTPIAVSSPATNPDVNFELVVGGRIAGTIRRASTGEPIAGVQARVYDGTGVLVAIGTSGVDGRYVTATSGLPTGTYYVRTENFVGLLDQLYPGIDCPGECPVTAGQSVAVSAGLTTPGVDLALGAGVAPPAVAPVPVGPGGAVTTNVPTFAWRPVPGAVGYVLVVDDSTQQSRVNVEYTAIDVRCVPSINQFASLCVATPTVPLAPGAARWRVAAVTAVGLGAWSPAMEFTVGAAGVRREGSVTPALARNDSSFSARLVRLMARAFRWSSLALSAGITRPLYSAAETSSVQWQPQGIQ